MYIYIYIQIYMQGAGNFAELCSEAARGISSTNAQNSRITVGVSKTLARNQETRKAYSKTFAKLAPQHGHAFLDAIYMHTVAFLRMQSQAKPNHAANSPRHTSIHRKVRMGGRGPAPSPPTPQPLRKPSQALLPSSPHRVAMHF